MMKILKSLVIIFLGWSLLHLAIISVDGLNDDLVNSDVAVVLGNKVERNGEPSKRLKRRLDKAIVLYQAGYCKHVIVSGGVGKEGFDEAQVMGDYLLAHGIDEKYVILDHSGNNTLQTACNVKQIMEANNFKSIIVVSQFYHISRTKLIFAKIGIRNVKSAHAEIFEFRDLYSLGREFVAYYRYLFYKVK